MIFRLYNVGCNANPTEFLQIKKLLSVWKLLSLRSV